MTRATANVAARGVLIAGFCAMAGVLGAVSPAGAKPRVMPMLEPALAHKLQGVRPLPRDQALRSTTSRSYADSRDAVWLAALHVCRQSGVILYLDPGRESLVLLREEYAPDWKSTGPLRPMLYPYTLLLEPVEPNGTRLVVAKGYVYAGPDSAGTGKLMQGKDGLGNLPMGAFEQSEVRYSRKRKPVYADSILTVVMLREDAFRQALLDHISTQLLAHDRWPWLTGTREQP